MDTDYSWQVPSLTKEEEAWIRKLEKLLLACPSDRIALQTIGYTDLSVIDSEVVDMYDLETCDGKAKDHGVELAVVKSKPQIWGVSG